ncbi:MAG: hypothetical protein GWO04_31485, partial [Actinobacteria bacterium]|nr:hypothetical protein [Actinomycetota bacterium]
MLGVIRRSHRVSAAVLVALGLLMPATPATAGEILDEPFEADEWWLPEVDEEGMPVEEVLWLDVRSADEDNTDIVTGFRSNGLAVRIPAAARRGSGPFYLMPKATEQAWFRYHLNLDSWNAVDNGKLPGFADVGASSARGCNPSLAGDPGWSARVMFHETGTEGAGRDEVRLGYYTYHLDQPGSCGEAMPWSDGGIVEQDRWYCIEGHVAMNTPGANDGVLTAWVDGEQVFSRDDLAFRRSDEAWVDVNTFWLNVYFGGSSVSNPQELSLRLDELMIGNGGRIGCLTRFTDDDGNPHEPDIEFLFAEGVVAGCRQNLYCPAGELSRAQWLVLLRRYLDPPATAVDYFDDDDGHWAE